MENTNIDIEQIKNIIEKLKLEILEKEEKVDELLKLLSAENEIINDFEEEYY